MVKSSDAISRTRRRSILKNSTPVVPDSTTQLEYTEANTRQNSNVDRSKRSYFANAVNILDRHDTSRHIVVPRKSKNAYNSNVEVPYTDRAVPETSPEPPDYTRFHSATVLRRNEEAEWTSRMPAVSKDLKALTRSVSREHGTLSQSVRRRPSLRFQSPVKVT